VSAILKALKKLEQETAINAGASLPRSIKGQNARRSKSLVVPGLIVLSLCALTGIGASLFVRKSSVPESSTALLRDKKPVSLINIPAEMIPRNRAAETDTQKQKGAAIAAPEFEFSTPVHFWTGNRQAETGNQNQESFDTQTQGRPVDLPGIAHPPEPLKTADPIKIVDPFSPIIPTPEEQPDAESAKNQPIEENENPAAPLQPDTSVSETPIPAIPDHAIAVKPIVSKIEPLLDRIEDTAIQLQAISWSADADKRLAIINGKICREKDPVAGYVVQSIHSGEVILSKGSVKGRLVFKIR